MLPARVKSTGPLDRSAWIKVGLHFLAIRGVDSVKIENLAVELGVSKGSFYWHFKNREDFLQSLIETWVVEQGVWAVDSPARPLGPAERWARLLDLVSDPTYSQLDVAVFSWARRDERVQRRVSAVEKQRVVFLLEILRDIGFNAAQAAEWSRTVMLVYAGWINRASRDGTFGGSRPSLADALSRIILAASALSAQETTQH
jgi:AcrR family transcriptional regulator